MKCDALTASTSEKNGTTIIEITFGQIFVKNFSRNTRQNPARIAGIT